MATRTSGKRKMARKSAKSSSRKGPASKRGARKSASARKGASARKSAPRRPAARKSPARKSTGRRAQVARVKRVAREVVQQAQGAVVAGVETLKDLGENLMERVRAS